MVQVSGAIIRSSVVRGCLVLLLILGGVLGDALPAAATPGVFQNATSTSALGTSSRALTVPTSTAAGDVLIAQVVTNHTDLTGTSAPAGWTLACSQGNVNGVVEGIWWHIAGSSEPATYTWTLPANSGVVGNIMRYTGVSTANPIDSCAGQASTSAGTSMAAPSITIHSGDEVLISAYGFTNAGTTTPAGGYTERVDAKTSKDTLGRAVSSEMADINSGACNATSCNTGSATATAAMLTGEPTPQWVGLQYGLTPSVPPSPYNTAVPVVSGRTQSGSTLSATTGTWVGGGTISYAYQWQSCTTSCTNIAGATGSTYVVASGDLGHQLQVIVTATNAGGSTTATSAQTRPIGYFYDDFSGSDSIITNEYAYWNPNGQGIFTSPDWEMTSGCLFRSGNTGATLTPDTNSGSSSINCSPLNNNNNFRLNSKASFSGNIATYVSVKQNTDIHDANCNSNNSCFHGTHVWMRYQNEYNLYYASINRADNTVVLKRKVPCGSDNSGTYFVLGSGYVSHSWNANTWNNYKVTVTDNANGSVTLALYDLATSTTTPIVTGTDSGGTNPNWSSSCTTPGHYTSASYTPLTGSGKVGIRGDFANMNIDDVSVVPN